MRRLLPLVAAGALAVPVLAPAGTSPTKLTGLVGPGFTITLKKAGKKVTTLPPGTYTITVADRASIHDFRLSGPGVAKTITGVRFTGTRSATFTLRKGRYTYICEPHRSVMRGGFTVR